MAAAKAEAEWDVGTKRITDVVLDFESYPKFLPEVIAARRLPVSDGALQVEFELELVKRFRYVLKFRVREDEIAWSLVDSDFFKKNEGRWVLTPISRQRTRVRYECDVAVGFLIPGWISRKLTEINLPRMLESFEKRAKSSAKKGS